MVSKKDKDTLLSSRELLTLALDIGKLGAWQIDLLNNTVDCTPLAKANCGLPADADLDVDYLFSAIVPEDRARVHEITRRAIEEHRPYEVEYRIHWPNGEVRWIVGRGQAVYGDDGKPHRVIEVTSDITAHKRATRALKHNEEKLRLTVEAADMGAWDNAVVDGILRLHWSARCKAMFGLPPNIEVTTELFEACLHPEDRLRTRAAIRAALDPGGDGTYDVEYRVVRPDGRVRWMISKGGCFFEGEGAARKPVRFVGVLLDITERRAAEEERRQFGALVEQSTDLIGMATLKGRGFYLNRAGCELLGVEYPEGVRSLRLDDFLPAESQKLLRKTILPAVRKTGRWQGEVWFRHSGTGELIPMDQIVFMVRRPQTGETVCYATVARDMRERKRAERELAQVNEALRDKAQALTEADRRKDEFLAVLAHELRNPLAPLRNNLQLLRMVDGEQAMVERTRSMMERQLNHMVRLIDDLLDVSRITRGKIELRKQRVTLASAVEAAVEASRPALAANDHSLDVTLPPAPVLLEADLARLTQIFSNLLNNAAKFTPCGGRIELRAAVENDMVAIRVRDNGVGIPPHELPHIFDMFTQVHDALERSHGGLGIGLTLVKRLVALHGGSVEARSDYPGGGSEFTVRLPFVPAVAVAAPAPVERPLRQASGQRRVLVADDNRDAADSTSMLLSMLGGEVRTAYNGSDALEQASAFRPDLILLDIGMPDMNGYDVARRIRAQSWGTAVQLVAVTGWGQQQDRERSSAAGFDRHLVKPVDPDVIQQLLENRPAPLAQPAT